MYNVHVLIFGKNTRNRGTLEVLGGFNPLRLGQIRKAIKNFSPQSTWYTVFENNEKKLFLKEQPCLNMIDNTLVK
jgi:hypothetical protein